MVAISSLTDYLATSGMLHNFNPTMAEFANSCQFTFNLLHFHTTVAILEKELVRDYLRKRDEFDRILFCY